MKNLMYKNHPQISRQIQQYFELGCTRKYICNVLKISENHLKWCIRYFEIETNFRVVNSRINWRIN